MSSPSGEPMLLAIAGHPPSEETDRLKILLLREGYHVAELQDGPDLPRELGRLKPDGAILLSSSPREAAEALRSVRAISSAGSPAIFCVHLFPWPQGAVECLDAGADDFLSKPFNSELFLARIRALLRRRFWSAPDSSAESSGSTLEGGDISLNLLTRQADAAGKPVPLTRLEFDLLAHLMRKKDEILCRRIILQAVWRHPEDVEVDTRTVDKHVESLRAKLGPQGRLIKTSRGNGYFFES